MHLGEEGSRNRMKATMRIMRLMLSLSFLFYSAFPEGISEGTNTTAKSLAASGGSTSSKSSAEPNGSIPIAVTTKDMAAKKTTADVSSNITISNAPSTVANSTASLSTPKATIQAATSATVATPTTSATVAIPATVATPTTSARVATPTTVATSVTVATSANVTTVASSANVTTVASSANVTTVASANVTTVATVATSTVATADNGSIPGGFPSIVKVQTPEASVHSTNSRTEPSVTLTANSYHVETSNITKVLYSTTGQTYPAKTSEEDTEKTTLPVSSNGQIKSRTTETGKPETTSTSPTLTTGSHVHGTTFLQTSTAVTTDPQPKIFLYSLNSTPEEEKDKELAEMCKRLMANLQNGNCTLIWRHKNGKVQFDCVEINGKVKTSLITEYYEEITKKPPDNKTLIAILASCGALLIMIFILAICASHHRRSFNENQQHLTEELHTVENGYHDNPTLEVMEVQPEMQEKKAVLNGEFNNDSWIVPIDNLLKEDLLDEEDTHL